MAPPPRPVSATLLLGAVAACCLCGRSTVTAGEDAGGAGGTQGEVGNSGMVQMSGDFDFGSTKLHASKGRSFAQTSRVNQNFLRRGTRGDIERIHIERLLGRRGPDDWLLAGSDAWVERRQKLDREAMELRERIAIADA